MPRKRAQRHRNRMVTPLVAVSLLAAACGGGATGGGDNSPATIDVGLPTGVTSFANSDIVVADKQGFFREAGLTVRWKNFRSGVSVAQGVVGDSLDIGASSIEPVVNAQVRGGGLSVIGSYTDLLTVSMVVSRDITRPADLRGKRLGVQEIGAFREVMTRMVLQGAGLKQSDVQYVPVGAQAYVSALDQGKVQSAVLQVEQAIQAQRKNPGLRKLVDLNAVNPQYFYGTYFASKKWLTENRETAKRFLKAIIKAHRFMYQNKAKTVPIVAAATGFDKTVIDQAYDQLLTRQGVFPVNEGLDPARIQKTLDQMQRYQVLKRPPPKLESFVDRGPISNAVRELGVMRGDPRWR